VLSRLKRGDKGSNSRGQAAMAQYAANSVSGSHVTRSFRPVPVGSLLSVGPGFRVSLCALTAVLLAENRTFVGGMPVT